MDFLEAPLVIGILGYFTYMIFELFARKQERMSLIEKMGQSLTPIDSSILNAQFSSLLPSFRKKSFTALRTGCLFVGLGLGLLTGLVICLLIVNSNIHWDNSFSFMALVAPILLFGGLGLIISYLIESKSAKKDKQ